MRTNWKLAAGTLAAAGALAVPASASAAITAGPFAPCYTATPPDGAAAIPVSLTGGTPGDLYQIDAGYPNQASGDAGSTDNNETPFDGNGNGVGTLTDIYPNGDPIGPTKGRAVDLTVEDFNSADPDPGYTVTPIGTVLITNRALDINFSVSRPLAERAVTVSGTQFAGKQVYGFVTNKAGTKVLRKFHLGTGDVCGYTTHKEIVGPTAVKSGTYRLYVNVGSKLNKKASLSDVFSISFF